MKPYFSIRFNQLHAKFIKCLLSNGNYNSFVINFVSFPLFFFSADEITWIPCPGSFLFCLKNPGTYSPQKIYPLPERSENLVAGGIKCGLAWGPTFGTPSSSDISTMRNLYNRRLGFINLGKGFQTQYASDFFVGGSEFLMHELEVFGFAQ